MVRQSAGDTTDSSANTVLGMLLWNQWSVQSLPNMEHISTVQDVGFDWNMVLETGLWQKSLQDLLGTAYMMA